MPAAANAASTNPTAQELQTWRFSMGNTPVPGIGCFTATYPSLTWQQQPCDVNEGPVPQFTVGQGIDEEANAGATLIGAADGEFTSITGFTSEKGSNGAADAYSLQINSQSNFICNTAYTGGKNADCWEQFIYANPQPGQNYGQVVIQYWLLNWWGMYHTSCPSTYPPGGTAWRLDTLGIDCYADSAPYNTPLYGASQLGSMLLIGQSGLCYPQCGSLHGTPTDFVSMCVGTTCYSVSETMYVLDLYSNWNRAEFNVFGDSSSAPGPAANFNTGISVNVQTGIFDNQDFAIKPSCWQASETGETNNMILQTATCAGSPSGYLTFKELLPSLTLSPTSHSHTSSVTITVSGSGYASSSSVTVKFQGTTKTTCTTTSAGNLPNGCSFTIAANTYGPGSYTVTATDASANSASATFTFT